MTFGDVERGDGRREDCRSEEYTESGVQNYGEHDRFTDLRELESMPPCSQEYLPDSTERGIGRQW